MKKKNYSCPNGCILPKREKQLKINKMEQYYFGYINFNFCPRCGALMPKTLKRLKAFFQVSNIDNRLNKSLRLLYKSEFEASARECFVVLENVLKKKSGLDLHGKDLVAQALNMEYDKKKNVVVKAPFIALNKLESESDYNEQEGIKLMIMGFFQGPRNLYQHNHIGASIDATLSVIMETSFFLKRIEGHSLTKKGRWIKHKIDYEHILKNMPKSSDRVKFKKMLRNKIEKNM